MNELMQKNAQQEKIERIVSKSHKKQSTSHKKHSIKKTEKNEYDRQIYEVGHFEEEEQCDLDETELDEEAHDAVKWKLEHDFDVVSGGGMGQQTMLFH